MPNGVVRLRSLRARRRRWWWWWRWCVVLTSALGLAFANAQSLRAEALDPTIAEIVASVSAKRIDADVRTLVAFGTRHTLSSQDDPRRGIGAARRWLQAQFEAIAKTSNGRMRVALDDFVQPTASRVPRPTRLVNVVATLPGTLPQGEERVVVVSGHYDSCVCAQDVLDATSDAPGANDDASGTAAVLELARAFARQRLPATVVFLAVAGEEQGLLGSAHWAREARATNRSIIAMFTNDIVGSSLGGGVNAVRDGRRVRLFAEGVPTTETAAMARLRQAVGGENDSPARQLARYVKTVGEMYVPGQEVELIFRRDRYGWGGDHISFLEQGFAAVRFSEANENFNRQHQRVRNEAGIEYGDVVAAVDSQYIARVARVNAAVIASLAMAPAAPAQVRFAVAAQEYDTSLTWSAAPAATGYRILWRRTAQPLWEGSVDIGTLTSAVVAGRSKDDYFFAVQALNAQGIGSVPAFPGPALR